MIFQFNRKQFNILVLLICLYAIFSNFYFRIAPELSFDVFGYYLYLPFGFIYHDLGIINDQTLHSIIEQYQNTPTFYQGHRAPETEMMVMKYTMGQSVLYAPFFFIGHLIASLTSYPVDGFSPPYSWSIFIGGIVYSIIGIYFFSRILLHFFNEKIAILVMIVVYFGTNFMVHNIMYSQNAMSHNYLLTVYAILIWTTIQWHKEVTWKRTIALGFLCGIATLIRPTEIVTFLIPLFWNVWNKESFLAKLQLLKKHFRKILVLLAIAFCIGALQLIYFKLITGSFIYTDYSNHAGEGLDLFAPYTLEVLFSYRKGWLLYTPIMFFSLFGFYAVFKRNRPIFWSLLIYFVIDVWFVSSWTCWWYAGSFSQRAMIPAYIVLGITFGYFLKALSEKKIWIKTSAAIALFLLLALNIFQTIQYHYGILHQDRMTKEYYWAIFGSLEKNEENNSLLMLDKSAIRATRTIDTTQFHLTQTFKENFEGIESFNSTNSHSGKRSEKLSVEHPFSIGLSKEYRDLSDDEFVWVKVSAWVYSESDFMKQDLMMPVYTDHKGKPYVYEAWNSLHQEIKEKTWTKITYNYLTPPIRRPFNKINCYFWLRNGSEVLVDDLQMEVWEMKK